MRLHGVFFSVFSSTATPQHHHHHHRGHYCPTHLSVLQQSRKFVAVGEVVVAIETDACCLSLRLLPLFPPSFSLSLSLSLNFSPWAVSLLHISQQFLHSAGVCAVIKSSIHPSSSTRIWLEHIHLSPKICRRGDSATDTTPVSASRAVLTCLADMWADQKPYVHFVSGGICVKRRNNRMFIC